jgi:hypothetical protein
MKNKCLTRYISALKPNLNYYVNYLILYRKYFRKSYVGEELFLFMNFFVFFFYCCAWWGYIVAVTKVLTICQIYHTWIHALHHSSLSSTPPIHVIISTGIIFPFTYMCTQYLYYIHSPTPFSHILPFPTGTNPQAGPVLPTSDFVKETNDIFV